MSNHRELFERLSKCKLPAGIRIILTKGGSIEMYIPMSLSPHLTWSNGWVYLRTKEECRAALMLIVDALESTGEWRFSRHRDSKGIVKCALTRCSILRPVPCAASSPDQVTAIAECLIAALGVKDFGLCPACNGFRRRDSEHGLCFACEDALAQERRP